MDKIKASCAWGDGPDVLVTLNDKIFICYEDLKNDLPWKHGHVTQGSFDLTQAEARELAHQLIQAADDCQHIENSYNDYMDNEDTGDIE